MADPVLEPSPGKRKRKADAAPVTGSAATKPTTPKPKMAYRCPLCEFGAGDSFSLTVHVQSAHSETSRRCKKTSRASPSATPRSGSRSASPDCPSGTAAATAQLGLNAEPSKKIKSEQFLSPQTPASIAEEKRKAKARPVASTSSSSPKRSERPSPKLRTAPSSETTGKNREKRKRSPSPEEQQRDSKLAAGHKGKMRRLSSDGGAEASATASARAASISVEPSKQKKRKKELLYSQADLQKMMDGDGVIKCPIEGCKSVFFSAKACYIHMLRCAGQGELQEVMRCTQCEKRFTTPTGLSHHVRTSHPPEVSTPIPSSSRLQSEVMSTPGQRASASKASRFLQDILTSPRKTPNSTSLSVASPTTVKATSFPTLMYLCSAALAEMPAALLSMLNRDLDIKCQPCGVRLTSVPLLAAHSRACAASGQALLTGKSRAGHTCAECSAWFSRHRDLDTHVRQHKPDPGESPQRQRTDKWRKSLTEHGCIPCEFEGCEIKLKTVSGMVYHHKTCRVHKVAQGEVVAPSKTPTRPRKRGDRKIKLETDSSDGARLTTPVDLVTLCAEQLASMSSSLVSALGTELDVKCRQCGVRLNRASSVAAHYKLCNPYQPRAKEIPGGTCTECNLWFTRQRDLATHSREHIVLTPAEQAQKERSDRWRKSLAKAGSIPCDHEGCDAKLTTVPGMVYHYKSCRVYKQSGAPDLLLVETKSPRKSKVRAGEATKQPFVWKRPDEKEVLVCDLRSLCMEQLCTWPMSGLAKLKADLDVTCPRCRVRLSSAQLAALHYKDCNPYVKKDVLANKAGYICEECNAWFSHRRVLDAHMAADHRKVTVDDTGREERVARWRATLKKKGRMHCDYENCGAELLTLPEAKHHHNTCKVQRKTVAAATQAVLKEQRNALRRAEMEAAEGGDVEGSQQGGVSPSRKEVDSAGDQKRKTEFSAEQMRVWHTELQHSGSIKCLTPGCNVSLRSMTAIKYHVKICYEFTQEDCTCCVCGKVVESPRMLTMHMRTHAERKAKLKVKVEKDSNKANSSFSDDVFVVAGRRRSAAKCLAKGFAEKRTSSSDESGDEEGVLSFSPADLLKYKTMKKKQGNIMCGGEGCLEVFTSLSSLKAHCKTHHLNLLVRTPGRKGNSRRGSQHRGDGDFTLNKSELDDARKKDAEDDEDVESVSSEDDSADNSSEEDVREFDGAAAVRKIRRAPSTSSKRFYPTREEMKQLPFSLWPESSKKLHKAIRCNAEVISTDGSLFPSLPARPSDWSPVTESEVTEYLSVIDEVSPPFCCHGGEPTTLPRFSSSVYPEAPHATKAVLCAGGAVWSADWCPTPAGQKEAEQFVLLSAKRTTDITPEEQLRHGKGLLQLWSCGSLSSGRLERKPSLELAICHDLGFIWSAQWCPSGVWQDPSKSPANGNIPRLGILAVASSSSYIGLISIPHPSHLPDQPSSPPVFRVRPCLKLPWARSAQSPALGQALLVSFHPLKPHRYLAAGFAFGTICIWDLISKSPLLAVQGPDGDELHPQRTIPFQRSPVKAMCWCPTSDYLLAIGYKDATFHIWDLRNPCHSIYSIQLPGPASSLLWLAHWPCLLAGIDGSLGLSGECLYAIRWKWEDGYHGKKLLPVASGVSTAISDISGSGVIAVGSATGSVSLIATPPLTAPWPYNPGLRGLTVVKIVASKATASASGTSVKVELGATPAVDAPTASLTTGTRPSTGAAAAADVADRLRYVGRRAFGMNSADHLSISSSKAIWKPPKHCHVKGSSALYVDITASLLPAILQVKWNNLHSGWLATTSASGLVLIEYHADLK